MSATETRTAPAPRPAPRLASRHWPEILAGLPVVALMLVWAAHDGGYDADTWYWGALVVLAIVVALATGLRGSARAAGRYRTIALLAFAAYVGWSYLSITWAASPGDALAGSSRALLYLLAFTLFAYVPWSTRGLLAALTAWALGVAVIGLIVLGDMAAAHRLSGLFSFGRLVSPTGYFNASAALFTSAALVATALAARRPLPVLLRGALIASACADLQLALLAESRGWLFTLPLVLVAAIAVSRARLRTALFAAIPAVGVLVPLHALLEPFRKAESAHPSASAFAHAAQHAGRSALFVCAGALVVGTILAAIDWRARHARARPLATRLVGLGVAIVAVAAAAAGGTAATHGHPFAFVKRQWNGFTHPVSSPTTGSSSYFATVGSGRYDFWRVAADAALAHPIGGLGQDNFADYYVRRRHTTEEPAWTHSLEFRLLAHTGFVGLALFAAFLIAAVGGALRARRRAERRLARATAGVALLPLIVWLVHGSVDWFWEMPALSGPALAFLGAAVSLGAGAGRQPERLRAPLARWTPLAIGRGAVGVVLLLAAVVALGFPYLAVREVSRASDVAGRNPEAALHDLANAADLNPLSADPARLAGTIALRNGLYEVAERRFRQAIDREPGGWFAWFGAGLAASALGDAARAHRDVAHAEAINDRLPAIRIALRRVSSDHPLSPGQALTLLGVAP